MHTVHSIILGTAIGHCTVKVITGSNPTYKHYLLECNGILLGESMVMRKNKIACIL